MIHDSDDSGDSRQLQTLTNQKYLCWSITEDSTEKKTALNNLLLLDLQIDTARFYNYSDPDEMKFELKPIKPVNELGYPEWIYLEAEMTQSMAKILKQKGMKKDDESDETKIYIKLYPNGNLSLTKG